MAGFAVGLALCVWLLAFPSLCGAKGLVLLAEDGFPPFSWRERGEVRGQDVDIVREACRRAGVSCEIRLEPWRRVFHEISVGTVDGGFAGYRTVERRAVVVFGKQPVHTTSYYLFVPKGHEFPFESLDDLRGRVVGMIAGSSLGDEFDAAVDRGEIRVLGVATAKQCVRLALAGHVDCIVGNVEDIHFRLKRMGLSGALIRNGMPVCRRFGYMMYSRAAWNEETKSLANRIDEALFDMRNDGTMQRISWRYGR